jgi:ferredoxin
MTDATVPAERWRVTVDAQACTGSGLCVGCAPDHFALGSDHRSRPRREVVTAADAVADAAECCPMEAITVESADTGRRLYPAEDAWHPAIRDGAGR